MRIRLQNFRKFEDEEFFFEDHGLILLKGPSGAGKSTVFEAFCYVFYGKVKGIASWDKPDKAEKHAKRPSVTLEMQHQGHTIVLYRQKDPNLLWIKQIGPGINADDVKRVEGKAAQEIINDLFGSKESWLACCYMVQKEPSFLLSTSQAQKIELLNTLSFNDEKPEEIVAKIQAELARASREFSQLEVSIERQEIHVKTAQEAYRREVKEAHLPDDFDFLPETDRAKFKHQLKKDRRTKDRLTEEYLAQQQQVGVKNSLLKTEADLQTSLAALPRRSKSRWAQWTAEEELLQLCTTDKINLYQEYVRLAARDLPVVPKEKLTSAYLVEVQRQEHQAETGQAQAQLLGLTYDASILAQQKADWHQLLQQQQLRQVYQTMKQLQDELAQFTHAPVSLEDLLLARQAVAKIPQWIPALELQAQLATVTGPTVTSRQLDHQRAAVQTLLDQRDQWDLQEKIRQREPLERVTVDQLATAQSQLADWLAWLPRAEIAAEIDQLDDEVITEQQVEQQRKYVNELTQALPWFQAQQKLEAFRATHIFPPTPESQLGPIKAQLDQAVSWRALVELAQLVEAFSGQYVSAAQLQTARECLAEVERFAPLLLAERQVGQVVTPEELSQLEDQIRRLKEYQPMTQLAAELAEVDPDYLTVAQYDTMKQTITNYDTYLRMQSLQKIAGDFGVVTADQVVAAREHFRHLETSKDTTTCPHCAKPVRIRGKELVAGQQAAPTKEELQVAQRELDQLVAAEELQNLLEQYGPIPSGISLMNKRLLVSRWEGIQRKRPAHLRYDQAKAEWEFYTKRLGDLPTGNLSVQQADLEAELVQKKAAYQQTERYRELRNVLGEVPVAIRDVSREVQVERVKELQEARQASAKLDQAKSQLAALESSVGVEYRAYLTSYPVEVARRQAAWEEQQEFARLTRQEAQLIAVVESLQRPTLTNWTDPGPAQAELDRLIAGRQVGLRRNALEARLADLGGRLDPTWSVKHLRTSIRQRQDELPELQHRAELTAVWVREESQVKVVLPLTYPEDVRQAQARLVELTHQHEMTQQRLTWEAQYQTLVELSGVPPVTSISQLNRYQAKEEKKLARLEHQYDQTVKQTKQQAELDRLVQTYGVRPQGPLEEPLSQTACQDVRNRLEQLVQINYVARPLYSSEQLKDRLRWEEIRSEVESYPIDLLARLKTGLTAAQASQELSQIRKKLEEARLADQQRSVYRKQLEVVQADLAAIVIDETLKDRLDEVSRKVRLAEDRLELSKQFDVLQRRQMEVVALEKTLQEDQAAFQRATSRLTRLRRLRTLSAEIECQALDTTADTINLYLAEVATTMFEDPILIRLCLEKELKSNKMIKQEVNLQLAYQNTELPSSKLISGGEQDRVSLAITLALSKLSSCPLLCLDECLSSLENCSQEMCLKVIRQACCDTKTVIVCCHGMTEGYFDSVITVKK